MFYSKRGFTLIEVLLALSILGVITIFSIPKLLQIQQSQQKNAIVKEGYAVISNLMQSYALQGSNGSFSTYILNNVNAVKLCPIDVVADGCSSYTISTSGRPGFLLASGACIRLLEWSPGIVDVIIDWNNKGFDYGILMANTTSTGVTPGTCSVLHPAYRLTPYCNGAYPSNDAFFSVLFN